MPSLPSSYHHTSHLYSFLFFLLGNCQLSQFFLQSFQLPFYYPPHPLETPRHLYPLLEYQPLTSKLQIVAPTQSFFRSWRQTSCGVMQPRTIDRYSWLSGVRWASCFWAPLLSKGATLLFHALGPRRLNVTFPTNDKLPHGIRHSVTDSCLRGLVPVPTSSSTPVMQSLINRREK